MAGVPRTCNGTNKTCRLVKRGGRGFHVDRSIHWSRLLKTIEQLPAGLQHLPAGLQNP